MHEFRKLTEQIELQPILDHLMARPPLDLAYGVAAEARLPEVAGGLVLLSPEPSRSSIQT